MDWPGDLTIGKVLITGGFSPVKTPRFPGNIPPPTHPPPQPYPTTSLRHWIQSDKAQTWWWFSCSTIYRSEGSGPYHHDSGPRTSMGLIFFISQHLTKHSYSQWILYQSTTTLMFILPTPWHMYAAWLIAECVFGGWLEANDTSTQGCFLVLESSCVAMLMFSVVFQRGHHQNHWGIRCTGSKEAKGKLVLAVVAAATITTTAAADNTAAIVVMVILIR